MKPSESYKLAMAQMEKSLREIAQEPKPALAPEPASEPELVKEPVEEETQTDSDWVARMKAAKEAAKPEEE